MDTSPQLPSVLFLIRLAYTFEDTFAHRAEIEAIWRLPSRERKIEELVRWRGMSPERAARKVDQKFGFNCEYEKVQQARQQLASEQEAALRAERRAEVEKRRAGARRRVHAANQIKPIHVKRLLDYSEIDDSQFEVTDFGPYEQVPVGG